MNRIKQLMAAFALIFALTVGFALGQHNPTQSVSAEQAAAYYAAANADCPVVVNPATGHRADGGFACYIASKGLMDIGYPISDLRMEVSKSDGKSYNTQWFERARLEYHPENQPPFHILEGLTGAELLACLGQHGNQPGGGSPPPAAPTGPSVCTFPNPGNVNDMPKTKIELASSNTWFHRVYNERIFNAQNNWGGADSWFVSLALGPNKGGNWTSHGNPGQVVYRGTSNHIEWCLGLLTTGQYKDQFMAGASGAAAVNVRIAPNSMVSVRKANGQVVSQKTSDAGDITIILPDSGVVVVSVSYDTAASTHESLVWWGPYDRSEGINTIDAR